MQSFNAAPTFTAPELYQALWKPNTDEQKTGSEFNTEADIWSLGIITYYLLTGRLLFTSQRGLLSYYENSSVLPSESLDKCQYSDEAFNFLKDVLKPGPSERLSARDALDHAWLAPLLQDSEPGEQVDSPSSLTEKSIPPLQPRKPRDSADLMLPGTINLTGTSAMLGPSTPLTLPSPQRHSGDSAQLTEMFQQGLLAQQQQHLAMAANQANGDQVQMQSNMGSLGMNDESLRQIPNNAQHPLSALNLLSNVHSLHRSATESNAPAQTQLSEPQMSDSSLRPAHLRQASQLSSDLSSSETGVDTLPPYTRRRSDAAPIPLSDLDYTTPQAESPVDSVDRQGSATESSRGSSERHSSDHRFSDRFRRVSGSIMPKRHQRSLDHGKKDKDIGAPLSPTR